MYFDLRVFGSESEASQFVANLIAAYESCGTLDAELAQSGSLSDLDDGPGFAAEIELVSTVTELCSTGGGCGRLDFDRRYHIVRIVQSGTAVIEASVGARRAEWLDGASQGLPDYPDAVRDIDAQAVLPTIGETLAVVQQE